MHRWQWIRRGVSAAACRQYFGNCDDDGTSARLASTWRSHRLEHVDSFDVLRGLRLAQVSGQVRASA